MGKITLTMAKECYLCSTKILSNKMTKAEAIKHILITNMKENSIKRYLDSLTKLISGKFYHSTMKGEYYNFFFQQIYKDYGKDTLRKSLNAATLHVNYYKHPLNELQEIIKQFKLK